MCIFNIYTSYVEENVTFLDTVKLDVMSAALSLSEINHWEPRVVFPLTRSGKIEGKCPAVEANNFSGSTE